jgi:hypothetical protein
MRSLYVNAEDVTSVVPEKPPQVCASLMHYTSSAVCSCDLKHDRNCVARSASLHPPQIKPRHPVFDSLALRLAAAQRDKLKALPTSGIANLPRGLGSPCISRQPPRLLRSPPSAAKGRPKKAKTAGMAENGDTQKVSALDGQAPEGTDFANYFCTYAYLYHQVKAVQQQQQQQQRPHSSSRAAAATAAAAPVTATSTVRQQQQQQD